MKTKKARRDDRSEKINIVDFYRELTHYMQRNLSSLRKAAGVDFPKTFLVTAHGDFLESDSNQVVKRIPRFEVASAVQQFLSTKLLAVDGWQWTAERVQAFVSYYQLTVTPTPEPRAWAWLNDDGYTFHRIPFEPAQGATPLWDEVMSRMDNAAAFQVWVGSLFHENADRQTYCWLYGQGQNSKGAILRALQRVFGSAYKAEQVPAKNDKFWTYWLLGKRLVAFGDTNDARFVSEGLFKSLTGGDSVRMEIKGGASFCAELSAMFLFASNARPKISSEKADMRRLILCELSAILGDPSPDYEERLWAEMPAVVFSCLAAYRAYGVGRPVVGDTTAIDAWVGQLEDKYRLVFEHHFELLPLDPDKPDRFQPQVQATAMTARLHAVFRVAGDAAEFLAYIERRYGIRRKRVWLPGDTSAHCYLGVAFRVGSDLLYQRI